VLHVAELTGDALLALHALHSIHGSGAAAHHVRHLRHEAFVHLMHVAAACQLRASWVKVKREHHAALVKHGPSAREQTDEHVNKKKACGELEKRVLETQLVQCAFGSFTSLSKTRHVWSMF